MNDGDLPRPAGGSHDPHRAGRAVRFGLLILMAARPALASSREDCAVAGACCFPRASGPGPLSAVPRTAKLASLTVVEGGLGRPTVKRVLAVRTAALGACAHGVADLRAHLLVTPSGIVAVQSITDPTATCVTEVLRTTKFPASTGVTELDLRLTW